MDRLVLVAQLKPGGRERAQELIAANPEPSAIEATLDRRGIFLAER